MTLLLLALGCRCTDDAELVARDTLEWREWSTGVASDLHGLDTDDDGVVWAVGEDGVILRALPGEDAELQAAEAVDLMAVDGSAGVAVGLDGMVSERGSDGSWAASELWEDDLHDLAPVAGGHVVVGADGLIAWLEGGEFTLRQSPTVEDLHAVSALGEQVWAVGDDGVVVTSEDGGQSWTLQEREEVDLFAVDLSEEGVVYGGDAGVMVIAELDGSTTARATLNLEGAIRDLEWVDDRVRGVGDAGRLFVADGSSAEWSTLAGDADLSGFAANSSEEMFVVGERGEGWWFGWDYGYDELVDPCED